MLVGQGVRRAAATAAVLVATWFAVPVLPSGATGLRALALAGTVLMLLGLGILTRVFADWCRARL